MTEDITLVMLANVSIYISKSFRNKFGVTEEITRVMLTNVSIYLKMPK